MKQEFQYSIDRWIQDAGLESSVVILPEVSALKMSKKGQSATAANV